MPESEEELISILASYIAIDLGSGVAEATYMKITEDAFVNEFNSYSPKMYEEIPEKKTEPSSWVSGMWSSSSTKVELAPHVFNGLQSAGIVVWQGFFMPQYVVYANNITKENVELVVSGLPEEVKAQYKIDKDRLYDFLKSKYATKSEKTKSGGKRRRVTKKKKPTNRNRK